MKIISFCQKDTGIFNGQILSTDDETLVAANIPPDHLAIEGAHDHLCKRVDVATGQVVDYQPPAPSVDHEWDEVTKRWRLNATVAAREAARASAIAQISALEAKQDRALRELALDYDGARERLDALDKQIIELRAAISA